MKKLILALAATLITAGAYAADPAPAVDTATAAAAPMKKAAHKKAVHHVKKHAKKAVSQ